MEKFTFKIPGFDLDPLLFLLFIMLPICAALVCLFYSFLFLKKVRELENTAVSKIRSAAQGFVRLKGKMASLKNHPVLGNLSHKPCVWYRYYITQLKIYHMENETLSRWEPIAQGASEMPFLLNDGTGECLIFPMGAEIVTTSTVQWYGHTPTPPPIPKPSLWSLFFGNRGHFCYREERLELESDVSATGIFHSVLKNDPIIEENSILKDYAHDHSQSIMHFLDNQGLGQKQALFISALSDNKVLREYRIKAFLFFLGFLFFAMITVSSTYPIVLQSLHSLNH